MLKCQLCHHEKFDHKIDFGEQPVSHRFFSDQLPDNYKHSIMLGQCHNCGLVQILNPFPVKELVPKFSWLTCTEPEGHLDRLVDTLKTLPHINSNSKILGLTFKEDTTLARFNRLGFSNTYRFDMKKDFEESNPLANVETAVDKFTKDFAQKFSALHGKFDIFICRHVIEHSVNIGNFIEAIKELTHDNSYIVIEIPECGSAFDLYDYTTVWEEHNLYFTPQLFKSFLKNSGFTIHSYIQEPYPLEDACIAIAQKSLEKSFISFEKSNYENFVHMFEKRKYETREQLLRFKEKSKIAIFGAGHMSVAFVNLMGIHDIIDYVIDDNSNKINFYLPGTKIKIVPSSYLYSENIKFCLMTLAPESEVKVANKHQEYVNNGGRFYSVFCKNPNYFLNRNQQD